MSALNHFPPSKGSSVRAAQAQTSSSSAATRPVAAPYWAGTEATHSTKPSTAHKIPRKPVATTATPNPIPALQSQLVAGPACQASPQIPRPVSPTSNPNNGRPQPAAAPPTAQPAITRFGSIRKAASNVRNALSNSGQAASNGPEISGPVPGSFALLTQQNGIPPMDLVGLAEARANVRRYGQADYELAGVQAVAVAARAARVAAAERANKPLPPLPSTSPMHKIPRKPVPASSSKAAAAPPRNPRRVLSAQSGAGTTFGDIIDAGMDSSWVDAQAGAQQVSNAPALVAPVQIANPPRAPRVPKPTCLNARGQEVRNPFAAAPRPRLVPATPEFPTSPLAATLAAEGLRPASFVPGIKCSDCGEEIDAAAVADHNCGFSAARRRASPHPTPSREAVYAADFPDHRGPPEVIVDTFVRDGHTSWVGVVRPSGGNLAASHQSRFGTGMEGRRAKEGRDAVDGAERFKDMLGM